MKTLRLAAVVVLMLLACSPALAQTGGGYDLTWSTIDGGVTFTAGGGYQLDGTVGQPDAGVLSGGGYELSGGFWVNTGNPHRIYLPLTLKNP
jgi:hypothetical protein